ncbi:unnamed protein product [Gongylonema pulchrum]|uniref:Uncharacterized protein n=1 Tax=Gongylonema pulchrum TaxID=637853 RepID=A0A183DHA0_9BILA|nr:unnamed protein product [Gongylonema pulchrum]
MRRITVFEHRCMRTSTILQVKGSNKNNFETATNTAESEVFGAGGLSFEQKRLLDDAMLDVDSSDEEESIDVDHPIYNKTAAAAARKHIKIIGKNSQRKLWANLNSQPRS